MVDFLKENLVIIGRIITILPLLLVITLFMGKRAIGQLPVFDFLIIVTLGAVVGADIADPNIHHFPTALAIVVLGLFQRIVANWKIANRKIGRLLTFEPTVVIQNGKLMEQNIRKIRYSIDNIVQMLREKNIFTISDVETAIIEASGNMSVLKKPEKSTVTREDLDIIRSSSLSLPVVMEGTVYSDVLKSLDLDEAWLEKQLLHQGISNKKEIFYAAVDRNKKLHISLKKETNVQIPIIKH
ncbi:DUF421 domain-containing protein [Salirhabdus sp. Marseille-P4669]|uniref:DUF421 domain-containing protein n=1 Tax=Salirhabdus sp. Marseille-P4669 TaxID=2042310 RepID=UPI000C79780C|nr:DUF421 domain-containing protein [Salirhabdus sp. Marseille-P4669]